VALLKASLVSRNIDLSYANAELGTAHGASLKGRILLRDHLPAAVTFSVFIHQVAHELLHTVAGDKATLPASLGAIQHAATEIPAGIRAWKCELIEVLSECGPGFADDWVLGTEFATGSSAQREV
jgi:hypothetical protein